MKRGLIGIILVLSLLGLGIVSASVNDPQTTITSANCVDGFSGHLKDDATYGNVYLYVTDENSEVPRTTKRADITGYKGSDFSISLSDLQVVENGRGDGKFNATDYFWVGIWSSGKQDWINVNCPVYSGNDPRCYWEDDWGFWLYDTNVDNCNGAYVRGVADTDVDAMHPDGKNYYVKGECTLFSLNPVYYTDICFANWSGGAEMDPTYKKLMEYFLDENGMCAVEEYTCPTTCSDGACVVSGTPVCGDGTCSKTEDIDNCPEDCTPIATCTDSDGGLNYYVNGSLILYNNPSQGYNAYSQDYCNGDNLREVYCDTNGVVDGVYGYSEIFYNCSNGCSDGACVSGNGCSGCVISGGPGCVPYGTRMEDRYCSFEVGGGVGGQLISQKETDASCDNGYECLSDVCTGGKCAATAAEEVGGFRTFICGILDAITFGAVDYDECVGNVPPTTGLVIEEDISVFNFGQASHMSDWDLRNCELFEFEGGFDLLPSDDACISSVADYSYSDINALEDLEVIVEKHTAPISTDVFSEMVELFAIRENLNINSEDGFVLLESSDTGDARRSIMVFWVSEEYIIGMGIQRWDAQLLDDNFLEEFLMTYAEKYPPRLLVNPSPGEGGGNVGSHFQ